MQDGPAAAREKWQRKRYPHDRQQPGIGRVAPVEAADEAEGAPHAASLQRRRQPRRVERLLSGRHLERRRHGNVPIAVDISRDREGIRRCDLRLRRDQAHDRLQIEERRDVCQRVRCRDVRLLPRVHRRQLNVQIARVSRIAAYDRHPPQAVRVLRVALRESGVLTRGKRAGVRGVGVQHRRGALKVVVILCRAPCRRRRADPRTPQPGEVEWKLEGRMIWWRILGVTRGKRRIR